MKFRRFEFVDTKSSKFWEICVDGSSVQLLYGRIGTAGQTQVKDFSDAAAALAAAEKQIAEKLRGGYREVTSDAAPALEASAGPAQTVNDATKPTSLSIRSSNARAKGKTLCISGKLPSGLRKHDYDTALAAVGIELVEDVVKGLDYLVLADPHSTSSKAQKARQLGAQVLSEDELIMITSKAQKSHSKTEQTENARKLGVQIISEGMLTPATSPGTKRKTTFIPPVTITLSPLASTPQPDEVVTVEAGRLKLTRSNAVQKQLESAKLLRKGLLSGLETLLPRLSHDHRNRAELLRDLIRLSAEAFDCQFAEMDPDQAEDFDERSANMLGGPFFTTSKYPQDTGYMPVVQLDLRDLSQVVGRNLGDGLLQLWYAQGRVPTDTKNAKIVLLPRSQVDPDLLLEWRIHDYDEAEVTPIAPLPAEFLGFYWRGNWHRLERIVSKGFECRGEMIDRLNEELGLLIGEELSLKVAEFSALCARKPASQDPVDATLFGVSESSLDRSRIEDASCIFSLADWGDRFEYGSTGSCELLLSDNASQPGAFTFRECWLEAGVEMPASEVARLNSVECREQRKFEHEDFVRHAR